MQSCMQTTVLQMLVKTEDSEELKNMKTWDEINVAAAVIRGYINVNVCKGHGALL